MLVPWRVFFREFGETVNDSVVSCDFIQFGLKVFIYSRPSHLSTSNIELGEGFKNSCYFRPCLGR